MDLVRSKLKNSTILICDDEADIREILVDAFEDYGANLLEASSVASAIKQVKTSKIDCIVTDIGMSDGTGIDLLKKIRDMKLLTPFILITGLSEYRGKNLGDLGVEALIFKPFNPEDVVEAVALKLESL